MESIFHRLIYLDFRGLEEDCISKQTSKILDEGIMEKKPIIVHTMGRVGSSTVAFACDELDGYETYHTHFLNQQSIADLLRRAERRGRKIAPNISRSLVVLNEILPKTDEVKMITLVRDPVARNLSGCFANFLTKKPRSEGALLTRQEVQDQFDQFYHDRPLWWFDRELKEALEIDLLAHPFSKEDQFQRLKFGQIDLLAMQAELDDEIKLRVLQEFLGTNELGLKRRNVHAKKDDRYGQFLQYAPVTSDYMDKFYDQPYVKHFYTTEAIAEFRKKWSSRIENEASD